MKTDDKCVRFVKLVKKAYVELLGYGQLHDGLHQDVAGRNCQNVVRLVTRLIYYDNFLSGLRRLAGRGFPESIGILYTGRRIGLLSIERRTGRRTGLLSIGLLYYRLNDGLACYRLVDQTTDSDDSAADSTADVCVSLID